MTGGLSGLLERYERNGIVKSVLGPEGDIVWETNFQLILLTSMLSALGLAMLAPMMETLTGPLGASPANIGLIISVYTAPPILLIPLMGVLADKLGRKTVLVPSVFVFGLAGTAIAFTTSFQVALVLRLIQGVAFSGILPILLVVIRDLYDGPRESTAQGIRITAAGTSSSVIPALSGLLVLVAWQLPFLMTAVAIPVSFMIHRWFHVPSVSAESDGDDPSTSRSYLRELLALLRRPRVVAILVGRALPVAVWIAFVTYISLIVVEVLDGSAAQAGLFVSLWSIISAASATQAGRVTAFFDTRFTPLIVANACLGVGFALVLFAPSMVVAAAGTVLAGSGIGISVSLFTSILTNLAPQNLRGGLVSLGESVNRTAQTATPVAVGGVISTTEAALGTAAAIQLAGLGVALVGAGGSIVCLLVALLFPRPKTEEAAASVG